MTDTSDSMTVLRSRSLRLSKRLRADGGADGYDRAKHLDAATVRVADLEGVLRLLRQLIVRPDICVVRGALIDGHRAAGIRRLLHMDKATGELPTLADVPRRWLALDLEGVPQPSTIPAEDLAGCAAVALAAFPDTIRQAARIVQASASHGRGADIRLRVWVWLSRPTTGRELKHWLHLTPCDKSVFGAVQPIYTAAPVIAPGVIDPIPVRLLALSGDPTAEVPTPESLAPIVASPLPRLAVLASEEKSTAYVRAALTRAAHRIGTTTPGGRHAIIVGETARLARFVSPGLLASSDIEAVVRAAAQQAGKDDAAEVDSAIKWGLANPWRDGPLPQGGAHG